MTSFDLFAGYGGFTLALEKVYGIGDKQSSTIEQNGKRGDGIISEEEHDVLPPGWTAPLCIGFSEVDKYANAVLKYHWPEVKNYGDIKSIDARTLPDFDLLTGGFPCQSFSIAGKRGGFNDTRGTMFFEMARIAKEKKPKYWLAENVKGLVSHDKGKTLKTILATIQELGYSVSIEILNAKFYRVPQNRERIFIFGWHIPTICKEVLNIGQPKKTDDFVKITKGFLFQTLLNSLAEVQKLQEVASKDLVCGWLVLNAIIEAGRKGKFIFSNEISKNLYERLSGFSQEEMRGQFITRQGRLDEKPNIKDGISTGKEENISLSAEDRVWQSIALLLSDGSDANSPEQKMSITSTVIRQTMEKTTFTYAEMLRAIVCFMLRLRSSSSPLWNEVLSDLIILKVDTNYEPITSQNEERIVGRSGFVRRSNLSASLIGKFIVECHTGDRPAPEVFFERGNEQEDTRTNGKEVAYTLDASYAKGTNTIEKCRRQVIKQLNNPTHSNNRPYDAGGISPALNTAQGGNRQPKIYDDYNQKMRTDDLTCSLTTNCGARAERNGMKVVMRQPLRSQTSGVKVENRIRRLTPTECERLMGIPDGWTSAGGTISDSQRYKLCGNGVCVPVVEHILRELILSDLGA